MKTALIFIIICFTVFPGCTNIYNTFIFNAEVRRELAEDSRVINWLNKL